MDGRALEAWQGPEQQTVRQATAWSRLREAEAAAADRLFELGADPETLTCVAGSIGCPTVLRIVDRLLPCSEHP